MSLYILKFGVRTDMTRLGITFWPDIFPVRDMVNYAIKAEEKGFESVWIPEHYLFRDAFSTLGAIGLATKRIRLATGVVNLYTRHPALIAMSIATVDELSGGRAILGIGTGVSSWIEEQMMIKIHRPVLMMKEAIQIIRKLLKGENVTYNGQVFTVKNMKLGFKVPQAEIPIYIAAVGSKMLQLAGEIADGVILTAGSSLKYVSAAIENIKIGAQRAGKDLSKIDVVAFLICSISEDAEAAKNAVRELVAFLLTRPGRAELMLEKEDIDEKALSLMKLELKRGDLKQASTYVTEDMINSITVSGTLKECKQKIQEYRRLHVTLPVIMLVNQDISASLDLI